MLGESTVVLLKKVECYGCGEDIHNVSLLRRCVDCGRWACERCTHFRNVDRKNPRRPAGPVCEPSCAKWALKEEDYT